MENTQEIRLSSNWTSIFMFLSGVVLLVATLGVVCVTLGNEKMKLSDLQIVGLFLFAALFIFYFYLFAYICFAKIVGDEVVLKKFFRKPKRYKFNEIGEMSSFQIKRNKYVTVEMKQNHSVEKYIIFNNNSLFSFENKDAEFILENLKRLARKTKSL